MCRRKEFRRSGWSENKTQPPYCVTCLLLTKMGPLQAGYPRMPSHFLNRFWDLCIKGLFKCACSSTCSIFCPLLASPRSSSNYKLASAFLNVISSGHPESTISLRSRWKVTFVKFCETMGVIRTFEISFQQLAVEIISFWYFIQSCSSSASSTCQNYKINNETLPQMTVETKIWGHYNSWDN